MSTKRLTSKQIAAERFFVEQMAKKFTQDKNAFFFFAIERMFGIPEYRTAGYISEVDK